MNAKSQEASMSDLFDRVTGDMDIFSKLLSKIPGFKGYMERKNRRQADKLLRETIATRFEEIWKRISGLQRDLITEGGIEHIDKLEAAAIKLRQFIDRIRTAAYGYAGFFSAVKIKEEELAKLYEYDLALMELSDDVNRAVDNVEASLGTDGLPASIRNLTKVANQCVETFNHRTDAMQMGETGEETSSSTGK
jgi:hypothetical protein